MPIYEYQCEKCHHCFEILVFSSDDEKQPALNVLTAG